MSRSASGSPVHAAAVLSIACLLPAVALADREAVLKQIDLPHNYYFREMYLPQVTSGPSAVTWSPDSSEVVYSMQGTLWRQRVDSGVAEQITDGPGYDYQPDWSPDGSRIVYARYLNDAIELYVLDVKTGAISQLTSGGAVNVEPRWSPDGSRLAWVSTAGTGHFHVFTGSVNVGKLDGQPLRAERRSSISRYYYSPFDHEISPAWSPDGRELIFIANPETAYGTGGIWRMPVDGSHDAVPVRIEETTWKARPDWSPDGRRIVYSSYAGRQWHQLWVTTADGGDPLPLGFGEFDATAARWSRDAARIAYVSNEGGNTSLWIQEVTGGARRELKASERHTLHPTGTLRIQTRDPNGAAVAARIEVLGPDGRSYAPDDAWVHADDGFDRKQMHFERHYFHSNGDVSLTVPVGEIDITEWRGLENKIARLHVRVAAGEQVSVDSRIEPLDLPPEWWQWQSGDVHVHMNYGGAYRNTPEHLAQQAAAEDLDVVYNLVVNKEQRVPDIGYFSPAPDPASTADVLVLHGQEFHTSLWGHLGLLGLTDHFLIPDYAAYEHTAAASPYPSNGVVADLAHQQHALVGYVHPFDVLPDPNKDAKLTDSLPVDVALGRVDYYEVVGFSDHKASADIWQKLLNCGFRLPAAAGTDAMANFASLRGPVGMNRVYVRTEPAGVDPAARRDAWLDALRAGRSMATNGPLLMFSLEERGPGEELDVPEGAKRVHYHGWLRSIVPVGHLEIVMNDKVVKRLDTGRHHDAADFDGTLDVHESGWMLLRAWNDHASPDIFDIYPYATTNPEFVKVGGAEIHGQCDSEFFLRWLDRIEEFTSANTNYNTPAERQRIEDDLRAARAVFEKAGR